MTTETILSCIEESLQNIYHNSSESGHCLPEVAQNIRRQPYEILAIFDQCGYKICEQTNHNENICAVALPKEWCTSAHLMIHNHITDMTFSSEDIITTKNLNLQISFLVTPRYNFYLFRPQSGWPDIDDLVEEYDTIIQMYRHHRRYDYDLSTARHLALLKISQQYHITYRVTDVTGRPISDNQLKAS